LPIFDITICQVRSARGRGAASPEPGTRIIDVTSKAAHPWRRFSPMFPHGGIPIPYFANRTADSVEGVWQGLKRFEFENQIDCRCFDNRSMRDIKRTSRAKGLSGVARGRVLGHQLGVHETVLLNYVEARALIYLPSYRWVLEHRLQDEVVALRNIARAFRIVLLDYSTNSEVTRADKPLSHAALVRAYLLDDWPSLIVAPLAVPSDPADCDGQSNSR
jgi:hypothetical protein